MDILTIIRIAIRALGRNKMRSGLTMLGIIIGVAAVIAMVGIGQGAQAAQQAQIAAMGSNMLFVSSGTVNRGGLRLGSGATKTLVYDDMTAILREAPAVAAAAPGTQTTGQVVFGNDNWFTRIVGTEPQYFQIRDWPFQTGTPFSQEDVQTAANVAVIGETVRKNLFGSSDPIGQVIRIKTIPFRIVGLLASKGQSAAMGDDQDDQVFIPYTTHQKKLTGDTWLRFLMVSAVSKEASYTAQQQMESLLRDRHHIRSGQDDDFSVRNLADLADFADAQGRLMTLLLGSVASIALIVGGIGIMNIMLVSVTERTREIGVRKALGATPKNILLQFLIEAIVLCLLGGVGGIIFGWLGAIALAKFGNFNTSVAPSSILLAFFFSGFVGILFGVWPARRAASLDPIQSLRYE